MKQKSSRVLIDFEQSGFILPKIKWQKRFRQEGGTSMGPYYEILEDLNVTAGEAETREAAVEWQRWDEELVEEFGRWLTRIAKVFGILIFAVFTAAYIGCF
jgi:hypothetical protein